MSIEKTSFALTEAIVFSISEIRYPLCNFTQAKMFRSGPNIFWRCIKILYHRSLSPYVISKFFFSISFQQALLTIEFLATQAHIDITYQFGGSANHLFSMLCFCRIIWQTLQPITLCYFCIQWKALFHIGGKWVRTRD